MSSVINSNQMQFYLYPKHWKPSVLRSFSANLKIENIAILRLANAESVFEKKTDNLWLFGTNILYFGTENAASSSLYWYTTFLHHILSPQLKP